MKNLSFAVGVFVGIGLIIAITQQQPPQIPNPGGTPAPNPGGGQGFITSAAPACSSFSDATGGQLAFGGASSEANKHDLVWCLNVRKGVWPEKNTYNHAPIKDKDWLRSRATLAVYYLNASTNRMEVVGEREVSADTLRGDYSMGRAAVDEWKTAADDRKSWIRSWIGKIAEAEKEAGFGDSELLPQIEEQFFSGVASLTANSHDAIWVCHVRKALWPDAALYAGDKDMKRRVNQRATLAVYQVTGRKLKLFSVREIAADFLPLEGYGTEPSIPSAFMEKVLGPIKETNKAGEQK